MATPDPVFQSRTTTQLLDALRDSGDRPAWEHVDARYRPVVAGFARRLGLSHADAEDVAQQTLVEFIQAYRNGRYDRSKGRLSSWILGIAHHASMRLLRTRRRETAPFEEHAEPDASDDSLRAAWDQERDRAILAQAMGVLRDDSAIDDRTLLAFELVGLRGVPAKAAAAQAGMSVNQVYVAKSRITKRLWSLVRTMTEAFEDDQ